MVKGVQQRAVETRDRLLAVATALIAETGYAGVRIDEIVARAGMAKGTFFAHFKDKDGLMDLLIAQRIAEFLDALEASPVPADAADLADSMLPLLTFMSCERYVFDVILRRSGAAALAEIGPIALMLGRHGEIVGRWLSRRNFRPDVPVSIQAEGVQAFMMQALALHFCALHSDIPLSGRFRPYMQAWLGHPSE
ncbi:TetR family transcriptional regulator [Niveispirillum lacus]|uniref:TetR family transcriptional regulator n=1 Tax=Niveispirillum lacus TaxID=1981099 RepID=A0A255Z8D4_9PROT|nr:TetR/AcrR family transcriptional regulator [Niveispirillum lacus]OYQ37817.1 TetR family transcriptional regulator [Niveispirillum lacus]